MVLAVTGGIAAFKSVLLLRLLRDRGIDVRVVLTESAARFVGEATFHALSGRPVETSLWKLDRARGGELHVDLAGWADAMVVYPATMHSVGALAAGLCDDLVQLTASCMTGPLLLCPAMHHRMAGRAALQEAIRRLEDDGVRVLPPVTGRLANGEVGEGRLPEPEEALEALLALLGPRDLVGRKVVVSAGPTREPLDPVRFLSNPSTGRMGFALARVARRRGADVTLVHGPVALSVPPGVQARPVVTAAEMAQAVRDAAEGADVVIMAAAVADYRPPRVAPEKLKKGTAPAVLELERTEDILLGLGADKRGRTLVGFAMETGDLVARAADKLRRKNLDLLVANDLTVTGAGFAGETNVVTILRPDAAPEALPKMSKEEVAAAILDRVVPLLR